MNTDAPDPSKILIGGILALIVIAVIFFVYNNSSSPNSSTNRTAQFEQEKTKRMTEEKNIIEKYFSAQMKGLDGQELFCKSESATTFFAVRKWEIVNDYTVGVTYTVRVESSTKGGIPIIKLWEVGIMKDKNTENYCISVIYEK